MMRDAAFWTKIGGFVTWMNFENYCGKAARKELGAGRTVTARIKSPDSSKTPPHRWPPYSLRFRSAYWVRLILRVL